MFESLSMPLVFGAFALAALVVLVLGTKMAGLADRIADSTGLGEAVTGGLLLGAATSLSGTVVSLTAALDGRAGLAFSNGIGGIAAQTAFLALADTVYRKANLEHSAADVTNVFQAALLSLMLVVPLGAVLTPDMSFWAVHPASVVLLVIYLMGAYRTADMKENPMWEAVDTQETRHDTPDEETTSKEDPKRQIAVFVAFWAQNGKKLPRLRLSGGDFLWESPVRALAMVNHAFRSFEHEDDNGTFRRHRHHGPADPGRSPADPGPRTQRAGAAGRQWERPDRRHSDRRNGGRFPDRCDRLGR